MTYWEDVQLSESVNVNAEMFIKKKKTHNNREPFYSCFVEGQGSNRKSSDQ